MTKAENKFRFAFDHAPKSATHFDGSDYSTFDPERNVYVLSLSVPELMFIKELNYINIPIQVIGNMAIMLES